MQSDEHLMKLVCKGNHAAFAELVRIHSDQFLALAYRTLNSTGDAEDILQVAFTKLWQNPHSWDPKKSKFTTWFYRVVLNACHDFRKKHHRQVLMGGEMFENIVDAEPCEYSRYESRQADRLKLDCLNLAMSKLPSAQRDALNLVVYCSVPQKHAAEILGIKLKALESLLWRARKNLSKLVNEHAEAMLKIDRASRVSK